MARKNTSGVVGVSWNKRDKKWRAEIHIAREQTYLGYFDDFFEAICKRKSMELKTSNTL